MATRHDRGELDENVCWILDELFPDRVYDVADGVVWVSGMNSSSPSAARRMKRVLEEFGYKTGSIRDDDAYRNGGVEFDVRGVVDG